MFCKLFLHNTRIFAINRVFGAQTRLYGQIILSKDNIIRSNLVEGDKPSQSVRMSLSAFRNLDDAR
jgi:hypothetical protein